MTDPRKHFLSLFDINNSHIINFPGFIFFCGGIVLKDNSLPPTSVRDIVLRKLFCDAPDLCTKIIQAEDIQEWLHFGVYKDLMLFEQHLASLANIIVLFVESPGSIAELGAFSFNEHIEDKLLIFIKEHDYIEKSFISLGPIKYLKDKYDSVKVYPWKTETALTSEEIQIRIVLDSMEGITEDIISDIKFVYNSKPKSVKFCNTSVGHMMLFLCDIMELFLAVKLKEIQEYFEQMEIPITIDDLKKLLFILKTLELIKEFNYGNDLYYTRNIETPMIKYHFKDSDFSFSRVRIKSTVLEFYEACDLRRLRGLRKFRNE